MTELAADDAYCMVARIGRAHGIRGEVTLNLETDFPEWLARQKELFVEHEGGMDAWRVARARLQGDKLVVKFAEVADRNRAEELRGKVVYVTDEAARAVAGEDPDFFLNSDLVGLEVIAEDEVIGEVRDVIEMPAQNLLEVLRPGGATFLFPFADKLIERIDLDEGTIHVVLPEGLIDLNEQQPKQKPKKKRRPAES